MYVADASVLHQVCIYRLLLLLDCLADVEVLCCVADTMY
jgi:hypothetical protein